MQTSYDHLWVDEQKTWDPYGIGPDDILTISIHFYLLEIYYLFVPTLPLVYKTRSSF